MCTQKNGLVEEMFTNWLNMGFSRRAKVENIVHGVETHWLSDKLKVVKKNKTCWHTSATCKYLSLLISLK